MKKRPLRNRLRAGAIGLALGALIEPASSLDLDVIVDGLPANTTHTTRPYAMTIRFIDPENSTEAFSTFPYTFEVSPAETSHTFSITGPLFQADISNAHDIWGLETVILRPALSYTDSITGHAVSVRLNEGCYLLIDVTNPGAGRLSIPCHVAL